MSYFCVLLYGKKRIKKYKTLGKHGEKKIDHNANLRCLRYGGIFDRVDF